MHRISAHSVVVDSRSINEFAVKVPGEKRVGQLPEKLFQKSSNTIHIMLESFWISEVYLRGIYAMLDMKSFNVGVRRTTVK